MELLGGGEVKWRTEQGEPILRVGQTRRICRDIILGLDYCELFIYSCIVLLPTHALINNSGTTLLSFQTRFALV